MSTSPITSLLNTSQDPSSSTYNLMSAVNAALSAATGASGGGIDVQAAVNAALYALRAPERLMQDDQATLNSQVSALQDIQSKLTSFQNSVYDLSDPWGAFSSLMVTSSDSSVVNATAGTNAVKGSHVIQVTHLATTASYYSTAFASSSAALPTGSFDLQVGTNDAVTIPVDSDHNTTTLDGLASYINAQNLGVTASVITDASGARLALVSNNSGEAGDLTISNDTTGAGGNGMGFVKAVDGTNASLTVDGVPISSASNTVTGVIPGVTLTLDSEAPGKSVTISVQANLTNAASAINNFLNTYNTLVQAVNAQFKFDSSTNTAGPLAGDSGLRMLQQKLLADMAYSIPGNNGFVNLESIGISMQNDGTLTVDNTKLNDALTNHFADVQNLFQSSSPVGLAQNLKTDLMQLASPSQGPLSLEINFANQTINDLTTQIQDFEDRLQLTQQQLTTEYTNINNTLLQLPSLLNQINSQIDGLNLYGKKS